jgi:hypothetical protein
LRKIINVGSLACDDQSLGINASELVLGNWRISDKLLVWCVACDRKFQTLVLVGSEGLVVCSCSCGCCCWRVRERWGSSILIFLHAMRVERCYEVELCSGVSLSGVVSHKREQVEGTESDF